MLISFLKAHDFNDDSDMWSVMNEYLCATTMVVLLVQTLESEAWMFRSVCVSKADVACG